MSYTDAQVKQIVSIALSEFAADHEFTGYGIHVVVNAVHEVLDRPSIAPQTMYNKIKAYKGIKSMEGITLNVIEASEFIMAYLTGKARTESTKLSDAIKIRMAQALQESAETESIEN